MLATADSKAIRVAIVGPSGSGKSSAASALVSCLQANGLRVGIYKLAEPLYRLQAAFYAIAGRELTPGAQDQILLETIATRLRAISATTLVDDLNTRLSAAEEDVILNDDLRDDEVDWPVLRKLGFRIIRVVAPQTTRLSRLGQRGDPTIVEHSPLDEQIARIPADFVVSNRAEGIEHLQDKVRAVAERLVHDHRSLTSTPASDGRTIRLTTGSARVDLVVEAGASEIANKLCGHLAPAFADGGEGPPDVTIALKPFEAFDAATAEATCVDFALRRSSASSFNLDLRTGKDEQGRVVGVDEATHTAYRCEPDGNRLSLFVSERSLFHLLETVRYTALAAEQRRGSAILHASAVLGPRGAVLVLGDKGKGKTTTMLSLIAHHGLHYFSGDKVLVDSAGGHLRLRGWPDYPHVGFGTLRRFPDLARACGIDTADRSVPDSKKVLIEPARFLAATGGSQYLSVDRCDMLLFPDVEAATTGIVEVTDPDQRLGLLAAALEDAASFTPGQWHGLLPAGPMQDARKLLGSFSGARWFIANGKSCDLSVLL